jgi:hypothetical protein
LRASSVALSGGGRGGGPEEREGSSEREEMKKRPTGRERSTEEGERERAQRGEIPGGDLEEGGFLRNKRRGRGGEGYRERCMEGKTKEGEGGGDGVKLRGIGR